MDKVLINTELFDADFEDRRIRGILASSILNHQIKKVQWSNQLIASDGDFVETIRLEKISY